MPRKARIDTPGALHHIIVRGIELTGGGLIHSSRDWFVIKSLRRSNLHLKSDERVFGDSDFVEKVLNAADESLERKYQLNLQGYNIDELTKHCCLKECSGLVIDNQTFKVVVISFHLFKMSLFAARSSSAL